MIFQVYLILALLPLGFGVSVIFLFRKELLPLHPMELPGLGYGLGLLLWSWVSLLGYLLKLSLETSVMIGVIFSISFLVLGLFRPAGNISQRFIMPARSDWMIVAVVLVFAVFAYLVGASPHPTADTVQHLAYVRKFTGTGIFDPNHLQLSATYPQDVLFSVYSYNSVHPLYAASAMLAGVDPYFLVRFGSVVIGPMLLLSIYSAGYRLSNQPFIGVLAVLVMIVYWQFNLLPLGYGVLGARNLSYPNHVAIIPALIMIAILWPKLEKNSGATTFFVFLGVLAGALPLVHVQWWAYALFATGAMVLTLLGAAKPFPIQKISVFLASFLVASAIVMSIKLSSYTATNDFISEFNFNSKITLQFGDWFMFHPGKVYQGPQFFFIILSVFYLVKRWRSKTDRVPDAAVFLAALIVLIVVFLSNPITATLFTKLVPAVILARMTWMLSLAGSLLTAIALFSLLNKFRLLQWAATLSKSQNALLVSTPVLLLILIVFFVPQSGLNINRYLNKDTFYYNKGHSPNLDEAYNSVKFRTLLEKIPIGKTVLSAGRYGKEMDAAFRHIKMTYPIYRHLPEPKRISEQIDAMFSVNTSPLQLTAQLKNLPADYLLLWPKVSDLLAIKFDTQPEIFLKISDVTIKEFNSKNKRFILYQIRREML